MKVGLELSSSSNEDQDNKELGTVIEMGNKGGMGLLTVMEHSFQIPYVSQIGESMFKEYSVLNF